MRRSLIARNAARLTVTVLCAAIPTVASARTPLQPTTQLGLGRPWQAAYSGTQPHVFYGPYEFLSGNRGAGKLATRTSGGSWVSSAPAFRMLGVVPLGGGRYAGYNARQISIRSSGGSWAAPIPVFQDGMREYDGRSALAPMRDGRVAMVEERHYWGPGYDGDNSSLFLSFVDPSSRTATTPTQIPVVDSASPRYRAWTSVRVFADTASDRLNVLYVRRGPIADFEVASIDRLADGSWTTPQPVFRAIGETIQLGLYDVHRGPGSSLIAVYEDSSMNVRVRRRSSFSVPWGAARSTGFSTRYGPVASGYLGKSRVILAQTRSNSRTDTMSVRVRVARPDGTLSPVAPVCASYHVRQVVVGGSSRGALVVATMEPRSGGYVACVATRTARGRWRAERTRVPYRDGARAVVASSENQPVIGALQSKGLWLVK